MSIRDQFRRAVERIIWDMLGEDVAQLLATLRRTMPGGTVRGNLAGIVSGTAFAPSGLTGATAASRYVGATASGAPASGTFAVGDWCIAQDGHIWICTVAGTPGTWTEVGA